MNVDLLRFEGQTVAVVDVPATVAAIVEAAESCVPAWLVWTIVVALAGRELLRYRFGTPPRRES